MFEQHPHRSALIATVIIGIVTVAVWQPTVGPSGQVVQAPVPRSKVTVTGSSSVPAEPVAAPAPQVSVNPGQFNALPRSNPGAVSRARDEISQVVESWFRATLILGTAPGSLVAAESAAQDLSQAVVGDIAVGSLDVDFEGIVITDNESALSATVKVVAVAVGVLHAEPGRRAETRQTGSLWLVNTAEGWRVKGWDLQTSVSAIGPERARAETFEAWT